MNIACTLRWKVAFIGITLLGVAHPIRENISGAGYTPMDDSHSGSQGEESRLVAFITPFVKNLEQTSLACTFM